MPARRVTLPLPLPNRQFGCLVELHLMCDCDLAVSAYFGARQSKECGALPNAKIGCVSFLNLTSVVGVYLSSGSRRCFNEDLKP